MFRQFYVWGAFCSFPWLGTLCFFFVSTSLSRLYLYFLANLWFRFLGYFPSVWGSCVSTPRLSFFETSPLAHSDPTWFLVPLMVAFFFFHFGFNSSFFAPVLRPFYPMRRPFSYRPTLPHPFNFSVFFVFLFTPPAARER